MANEIRIDYGITGRLLYAIARNKAGLVFNVTLNQYEAYSSPNYADYVIALTDVGGGFYVGSLPVGARASADSLSAYVRSGTNPAAEGDTRVGLEDLSVLKIRAATYDSIAAAGNNLGLSNGANQNIDDLGNRITAE